MKKFTFIMSIMIVLLALATACGGKTVPPAPPATSLPPVTQPATTAAPAKTATVPSTIYPLTITDAMGRKLTFNRAPQKIVSLAPSNTEILYALGIGDRIIGVTEYDDYPEAAKSKPRVSSYTTPNMEKLVSIGPDLILAEEIHEQMVVPALEKLKFTVVVMNAANIKSVLDNIKQIGQISDRNQEASDVAEVINSKISAVAAKTAGLSPDQRPRVLYLVWFQPTWTMGGHTFTNDLIETAGGTNVFGTAFDDSRTVSLESVVSANPQVIIATGMGTTGDITINAVKNEDRLKSVDARLNNRVYKVDEASLVERPGPRIAEGLQVLARLIHPELFGGK